MELALTGNDIRDDWAPIVGPRVPAKRLVIPYRIVLLFMFCYFAIPLVGENPAVGLLRPIQTLVMLAIGLAVLEITVAHEPVSLSWPESHALLFFVLLVMVSAVNSYWPGLTIFSALELAKVVGIYLVMVNVITTRQRLRALYWALTLGILVASYGTWSNYTQGIVDNEGRAIYAGIFGNANDLAVSLLAIIPLTLSLLGQARMPGRLLAGGTIAFALVALFLTFSRQGVLGFIAAIGVMFWRGASSAMRRAMLAAAFIALLTFPFYSSFWERDDGFAGLEEDETFQNRIVSVQVGIMMFLDSPIVGKGLGGSFIGFTDYAPLDHQGHESMIHNTYAQALAETGLLGTLLFLTYVGYPLLHADRVARGARHSGDIEMMSYAGGVESSLAGFLVAAMAGPFLGFWLLYYIIGISSALRRIAATEQQELATP